MIDKDQVDANTKEEDGEQEGGDDWKSRYTGLSRKFTDVQKEVAAMKSENERLAEANEKIMARLEQVASSLSEESDDSDMQEDEDADPLARLENKIGILESRLEQEAKEREKAELDRQRIKLFADYGMTDYADIIAKYDDMDRQEEVIKMFAEKQNILVEEKMKKAGTPPKTKKPAPGSTKDTDVDALREALEEALGSGSRDKVAEAREKYYAALDGVVGTKWKFGK